MENLRKKVLVGVNDNTKEIYLAEFEITSRNGYKEFTASFYVGQALDIDNIDLEEECEMQWECLDNETKLDMLEDGEKTKQDVFDNWTSYSDYHDFKDCSCTDYELTLDNGTLINFETTCCGQHYIREDNENYNQIIFTNKQAVEKLLELWDKYHLKNVENNEDFEKDFNFVLENLKEYSDRETIINFIKENIKEL